MQALSSGRGKTRPSFREAKNCIEGVSMPEADVKAREAPAAIPILDNTCN
jgi:hypothetical protein